MNEYLESEAMNIIAHQIAEGYYSGFFDIQTDDEKWATVSWSIEIDITEND